MASTKRKIQSSHEERAGLAFEAFVRIRDAADHCDMIATSLEQDGNAGDAWRNLAKDLRADLSSAQRLAR